MLLPKIQGFCDSLNFSLFLKKVFFCFFLKAVASGDADKLYLVSLKEFLTARHQNSRQKPEEGEGKGIRFVVRNV